MGEEVTKKRKAMLYELELALSWGDVLHMTVSYHFDRAAYDDW